MVVAPRHRRGHRRPAQLPPKRVALSGMEIRQTLGPRTPTRQEEAQPRVRAVVDHSVCVAEKRRGKRCQKVQCTEWSTTLRKLVHAVGGAGGMAVGSGSRATGSDLG